MFFIGLTASREVDFEVLDVDSGCDQMNGSIL